MKDEQDTVYLKELGTQGVYVDSGAVERLFPSLDRVMDAEALAVAIELAEHPLFLCFPSDQEIEVSERPGLRIPNLGVSVACELVYDQIEVLLDKEDCDQISEDLLPLGAFVEGVGSEVSPEEGLQLYVDAYWEVLRDPSSFVEGKPVQSCLHLCRIGIDLLQAGEHLPGTVLFAQALLVLLRRGEGQVYDNPLTDILSEAMKL